MTKNYANALFMTSTTISLILLIQMVCYLFSLSYGSALNFNLFQACEKLFQVVGIPFIEYMLLGLVCYTILHACLLIAKQAIQIRKMNKKLLRFVNEEYSLELKKMLESGQKHILVIEHDEPIAITMGFFQPKIILSTGLWKLLSKEEIQAVLFHEAYHQKKLDPLKCFLTHLFSSIIWYIPLLKWISQQYIIIQEVLADDYAMSKSGNPIDISNALIKMIKNQQQKKQSLTYVSFAETSVNYRIKYILDPENIYSVKLPFLSTVVSLNIFLIVSILFMITLI
ncbi:M56 family metallopeptidase [Niallia nealsonii]|uniref:Peptidase M56 n=1 Tax=Niallia nealsonii TaxID=115979 RepID=A0A2N0Z1F3_9BACI|nr:M56 family metallopeptidase [Niallia nealsonii]PKG23333.1 peptidase M56 [Niallia nealsonii]